MKYKPVLMKCESDNGMGTGYLKCRNETVIKDYENVVKVREVEENP